MLDPKTLQYLNNAFKDAPQGFVVVDSGKPKFAVIDYEKYLELTRKKSDEVGPVETILVTGGAGYIGSITSRLLEQQGFNVIVYDNLSTGRKEAVSQKSQLIVADLADTEALDKVFQENKIDAVIHFAASIEVEESMANPDKYFQNNVINGLNLLRAMAEHGVDKIVFSSTAAVYGNPENVMVKEEDRTIPASPYGESKLMFERALKWYGAAYGINSVCLRYFNAAGAWPEEGLGYADHAFTHLIPRVLDVACGREEKIIIFGDDYPTPDGTGVRDYIHVLDLAEAHIVALGKLFEEEGVFVYNVGTGQGHSVKEVIDTAMEITGHMIPMEAGARRQGDPAQYVADSTKLQNEFSWHPQFDLVDIIESSWEWHEHLRSTSLREAGE